MIEAVLLNTHASEQLNYQTHTRYTSSAIKTRVTAAELSNSHAL